MEVDDENDDDNGDAMEEEEDEDGDAGDVDPDPVWHMDEPKHNRQPKHFSENYTSRFAILWTRYSLLLIRKRANHIPSGSLKLISLKQIP